MAGRVALTLLLLLLGLPAALRAQLPLDGCIDRADRPVRGIVRNDMPWAGVATVEGGESVIYWNQRLMGSRSRTTQIFVYLHECGHHMLGHVWKANDARWEQEADCWAVQLMWEGGMIAGRHLRVLEEELSRTRGDAIHIGGERLLEALRSCLAIKTDRLAWAASLARLVEAGASSFASIRGQGVPNPSSKSGVHESLVDLPGTYDCEVTTDPSVRCTIFAAKDGGRVADRFSEIARILPGALPASWKVKDVEMPSEGGLRQLAGVDSVAGLTISVATTPAHRIVFRMGRLPAPDTLEVAPPLPLDPIAFRRDTLRPTPEPVATGEAADTPPAPARRKPFVLRQG
ncbi:MAG: ImmA/IrrE family metallo-endopeptidase, partial [Gemmatimonadota bacterium]